MKILILYFRERERGVEGVEGIEGGYFNTLCVFIGPAWGHVHQELHWCIV